FDPKLRPEPLSVIRQHERWTVCDSQGATRAVFEFSEPETDHWSDLLPPPHETLKASFFPDGKKEVRLSSCDHFFPARHDAFALAFIEQAGVPHRATVSLHAQPDEAFVGTGERFAKMDLSSKTFQLKNQDGQGVNSRRTYKNIPFYLSSEMYGMFLHTSADANLSLADH